MREALAASFREASLLAIGAIVALVLTFVDLTRELGQFVVSVFTESATEPDEPLTWEVADRVINFGGLAYSGLAFGAAVLVSWILLGQRPRL